LKNNMVMVIYNPVLYAPVQYGNLQLCFVEYLFEVGK